MHQAVAVETDAGVALLGIGTETCLPRGHRCGELLRGGDDNQQRVPTAKGEQARPFHHKLVDEPPRADVALDADLKKPRRTDVAIADGKLIRLPTKGSRAMTRRSGDVAGARQSLDEAQQKYTHFVENTDGKTVWKP